MNERVRQGVTRVLGQIQPNAAARYTDEPRKAWLELMVPLFLESQAFIPGDCASSIFHAKDRNDFLVHANNLPLPRREAADT